MRVPKPPKTTLGKMIEEEELLARAAGCPPGHTYNPVIKKCLPGSPLSGIGYGGGRDELKIMPIEREDVSIMPIERIEGEKPLEMENSPKKSAQKKTRAAAKSAAAAYKAGSEGPSK